ncbi:hypothetical protein [Streptomyces sp. MNU103]|uniref:hypothetical protein n=1 Tax=Streptomyces sp. MNU103 TaxID=2560024 RepID=UPI001E2DFA03|nr:hypothetical protein [Streptomyces sp. MNU103]
MDEGLAAVIAGVAGTVGALGGGLIAGIAAVRGARATGEAVRQQVRDQAEVEHRQWLRGQRQQAYADTIHALEMFLSVAGTAIFQEEQRAEHMPRVVELHERFAAQCVAVDLVGPEEVRGPLSKAVDVSSDFYIALVEWAEDTSDDRSKAETFMAKADELTQARNALMTALQEALADSVSAPGSIGLGGAGGTAPPGSGAPSVGGGRT